MDVTRLKIKIGEHEFEGEGPTEVVQAQFDAFREMVAFAPKAAKPPDPENELSPTTPVATDSLRLDKIMKTDGRVVSLTAGANSIQDAIRLILLGQKIFRNNDAVTGGEIVDGLKQSGLSSYRPDRQMTKLATDGHVIVIGSGRATRYRLTNQGLNRAQEIAKANIATVA